MLAYTITAPLVDGTTYERTESGSESRIGNNYEIQRTPATGSENNGNWATFIVLPNGQEQYQRSNSGEVNKGFTLTWVPNGNEGGINSGTVNNITSPDGFVNQSGENKASFTFAGAEEVYGDGTGGASSTQGQKENFHVLANRTSPPKDSNGDDVVGASGPAFKATNYYSVAQTQAVGSGYNTGNTETFSQARFFNTIALQTTTQTTVTNNYKITTTTQEKLAKVGTTITQSVGTSVVTLPTTTNAKSWTENTTTTTTATEDATVVTTSMGIDSYWKKTAHTVYILGKGETTAFLKSDVALNATNGGPTDTSGYDTYSGPTTFTITRAAGTTSQKPVVADTATDTGFEAGEGSQTIVTNRAIVAANSTGIYYYPGYPHHFPLSSTNITIQTGASEFSTTQQAYTYGEGQWGANAPTTTRSAWGQTSVTYNLAGVSYTDGVPTYTQETYAQPIVRSGSGSNSYSEGVPDEYLGTASFQEEGANGFGEQANYFVNFQNQGRQNNGGGADAFYGLAYAWGTLGGTTAEPYQSISVDGINSSESVTWPFVSISAGVQTPKPFVTVSQKPETSATSSTAATKTEATTRRIWGEEFAKMTSSRQTAATTSGTTITGTSGSTTTPIQAGGAALTSFQLGGARGFPINQLAGGWIPAPAMFVVGGIAQTNDSTAIIPPGEYANSTITAPQTFSGSSIANTYFEPKAARTFICSPS
jgi:hypothetical protein